MSARLLRPSAARRYLGGQDPAAFNLSPLFVRGEAYYDRVVIDEALDRLSGLGPTRKADDPESALQTWLDSRGGAA